MGGVGSLRIDRPRSLTELVTERLREAIIEGRFQLGENISEDRLAEAFGVSRTPVHDALIALQIAGLVVIRPQLGTFVFCPTMRDVEELCEYRLMLESQAAMLSMKRNPGELVDALSTSMDRMRSAQEDENESVYAQSDTAFHQCFFDFCENGLVQDAFRLVDGRIATMRSAWTVPFRQRRDASYEEHLKIIDLLKKKDIEAFYGVLDEHINRTKRVAARSLADVSRGKRGH